MYSGICFSFGFCRATPWLIQFRSKSVVNYYFLKTNTMWDLSYLAVEIWQVVNDTGTKHDSFNLKKKNFKGRLILGDSIVDGYFNT